MIQLAFYLGTKRENPEHARWMDRLICWWTESRFSHVEFVAKLDARGTWGTCWAASNREGVVRNAVIALDDGRWQLVTIPRGDYQLLLKHFQATRGTRYGWLCVVAHMLPRAVRPLLRVLGRHRPYCSSIVAAGMGLADTWISPQQLYEAITGARA